MKKNNLKILITVGPTWAPVDSVRVLTNIFGGSLGIIITETLAKSGYDITLIQGPTRYNLEKEYRNVKVLRFKYYNELASLLDNEIRSTKFDCVIHSAAVSDYMPIREKIGKIKSGQRELIITLKPTKKLVDNIKKLLPNTYLVIFKLEVNQSRKDLIASAQKSLKRAGADLVLANEFSTVSKNHIVYMINGTSIDKYTGKENIAKGLEKIIRNSIL